MISNTPLSAKTGDNTMRLKPLLFLLRIDSGTFVIAEPTAPVLLLSLQLGTMYYRIIGRVYSLSRRAIGRCGNPSGKDTRRSSSVLGSGTDNRGQHIEGTSPETFSVNQRERVLNVLYLYQYANKPCLTWIRQNGPSARRQSNGHALESIYGSQSHV